MTTNDDVRLIGLSGYARSGKDETGKILHDDYGYTPVSFARALKNLAAELNPLLRVAGDAPHPLAWMFARTDSWDTVKDKYPSAREFLQKLGVACRDQIGEDVWVNALANSLEPDQLYVVTDVRFPNEAEWIRQQGGQVWRIVRPNNGPVNAHESETALDACTFDRIIYNNGSLRDLRETVLRSAP